MTDSSKDDKFIEEHGDEVQKGTVHAKATRRIAVRSVKHDTLMITSLLTTDYEAHTARNQLRSEVSFATGATRVRHQNVSATLLEDSSNAGVRNSVNLTSSYSINFSLIPYAPGIGILANPALGGYLTARIAGFFPLALANLSHHWSIDDVRSFSLKKGTNMTVNMSTSHNWGMGPTYNYKSGPTYGVMSSDKRDLVVGTYEMGVISGMAAEAFSAVHGVGGALLAAINGGKAKTFLQTSTLPKIKMNTASVAMRAGPAGTGAGVEVSAENWVQIAAGPTVSIVVTPIGILLKAGTSAIELSPDGIKIMSAGSVSICSAVGGVDIISPGTLDLVSTSVTSSGPIMAPEVVGGGVSLATHVHPSTTGATLSPVIMVPLAIPPVVPPTPSPLLTALPQLGTMQDIVDGADAAIAAAQNLAAAADIV